MKKEFHNCQDEYLNAIRYDFDEEKWLMSCGVEEPEYEITYCPFCGVKLID
jgi:hypothetical protein